jgi:hypothetical protein
MKALPLRRLGAVLAGALALALTCSACRREPPKPAAATPSASLAITIEHGNDPRAALTP